MWIFHEYSCVYFTVLHQTVMKLIKFLDLAIYLNQLPRRNQMEVLLQSNFRL